MTTSKTIRLIVCMSLLVVSFARPTSVRACSCMEPGLPELAFLEAKAVFVGKVVGIVDEYVPVYSALDRIFVAMGKQPYFWIQAGKYVGYRVHFRVQNSWKGVEQTSVLVDTGYGMGDCGYPFAVSSDYLVYASYPYGIPGDYWVTSVCSRTAEISAATIDLRYLTLLPSLPLRSLIQIFGLPVSTVALWVIFLVIAVTVFAYGQRRQAIGSEG